LLRCYCVGWNMNCCYIVYQKKFIYVGVEVFTAVVMESIIFWVMMSCSPSSFNRRFGGTYRLHLQGRRNKFNKNQLGSRWHSACHLLASWFLSSLFLQPWRWRQYVPQKRGTLLVICLLAGFCWTYFFDPEDGGDMFLRNVGWNSTDYTVSYHRRWYSSSLFTFLMFRLSIT
jgi:hypothetical protein